MYCFYIIGCSEKLLHINANQSKNCTPALATSAGPSGAEPTARFCNAVFVGNSLDVHATYTKSYSSKERVGLRTADIAASAGLQPSSLLQGSYSIASQGRQK
jgi:acyl dehydratase